MLTLVRRNVVLLTGVTLVAFSVAGCGGGSPDQTFQNWSTAVRSNNFPAAWECLAPETRGTVLQIMVLDADALSAASTVAKDAIGQAYSKVGLNPQDANFKQARLQVANPSGLAADLDGVFRQFQSEVSKLENSRYAKLQAIWTASAQSGLAKSQAQGTRATAAVQGKIPHTSDNASVQAVFEKVNGKWLLAELEENAAGAAMAGGPGGASPAGAGAAPGMPGAPAMPGAAGGPGAPGMAAGGAPAAGGPPGTGPGAGPPMPGVGPTGAPLAGAGGPMPAGGDPKAAMPAGAATPLPADPKNMPAAGGLGGPAMAAGDPKAAMPAGGATPKAGDPKSMPAAGGPAMAAGTGKGDAEGSDKPKDGALKMAGAAGEGGVAPGKLNRQEGGMPDDPNRKKIKPGSMEDAVTSFMERVSAGDLSGIDYYISSKAKGVLAEIRSGEISEERLGELKSTFQSPKPEGMKNTGSSVVVTVKGGLGHSIVLTAVKEEGIFKIKDMKILEPGAKNR